MSGSGPLVIHRLDLSGKDVWYCLNRKAGRFVEKLTQHGRDGIFPSVPILSGPPMADAVIAATIFHPHFPSMRAMYCDCEGYSGIICMFDAPLLFFISFAHFILLTLVTRVRALHSSMFDCTGRYVDYGG